MAKGARIPDWHVLDFFCDDADSCALTVLVRGFRFHIIADSEKLPKSINAGRRYDTLVQKLRSSESDAKSAESSASHTDTDSGVDVNDRERSKDKRADPEEALRLFVLQSLSDEFENLSEPDADEEETLQEWYNGPSYFYNLEVSAQGDLEAIQLQATPDLTQRMQKLKPSMALPKYMTDKFDVLFYRASDLRVISTSDQPPGTPCHPCRVRTDSGETFFLKIVDNNQPQTMKRELDILNRVTELQLGKEINVPCLTGLVTFDDASDTKAGQKRILGFLQTDIPSAQPLTGMLDPSIPQAKRERWAGEADRAKEVLHAHDIVWGDAKADNFVVDGEEALWIIDFGGSYTEGWVEAELKETVEGDDVGTERVVNALEDPVGNTYDPDEEGGGEVGEGEGKAGTREEVTFAPDRERKRRVEEAEQEGEARDEPKSKKARRR